MKAPVLVIAADPATKERVQAVLESAGFEVALAADEPAMLGVPGAPRPGLIVLDLAAPDLEGPPRAMGSRAGDCGRRSLCS